MTERRARLSWPISIAPAAILLVQTVLFAWMAPRGFDLTDESFYLLNYLYWRDLTATVTFFGAYFELPFKLLGQSIAGIRIFSLVALLTASAFFVRELLRFSPRSDPPDATPLAPFALIGITSSLFYFGYFAAGRAPSYNLLALCAMMVATGLLLRLTKPDRFIKPFRLTAFLYGVALGACALAKAPAGASMLLLHVAFFVVANRNWERRRLLELLALILAGAALNAALLQLAHPSWLSALREGVALTIGVGHGGLFELLDNLIQELRSLAPALLELSVLAAMLVFLGRNIRQNRRAQVSIAVIAVTTACALELARSQDRVVWLPVTVLSVLVLWSFETPWLKPSQWTRADAVNVATTTLLLLLPLAFSFGTNLVVWEHSEMAGVFGIAALLIRLQRLAEQRLIGRWSLAVSLSVLCVPTLTIQIQNAFDRGHAYRLRAALVDQDVVARVGPANSRLLLDTTTRDLLSAIATTANKAGFVPRQPVLDLTGDGPGLIYAMGGRPLGVAWLSGGYLGSEVTAAWLIAHLPPDALQHSWLLTSRSNPRRIVGWQRMFDQRLGVGSHERVTTIPMRSPYLWRGDKPQAADIDVWRPRAGKDVGQVR